MTDIIEITVDGIKYTQTRPGYYYKKVDGKQTRIPKAEWEQAFEAYTTTADDLVDKWGAEEEKAIEERKVQAEESDKKAEKKMKKIRQSKDVAFIFTPMADESRKVTLTTKQVAFLKALPKDDFFENGVESALWIGVLCDTVVDQFSPMAVGAMVSTLREKGLVIVGQDRINGKKAKSMEFTELGKMIATELGLA